MAIKALVLDFDSTISTPTFLQRVNQWAVADNVTLFNSMSTEEQLLNFGGKERIEQLAACLHDLKTASVELFIVSIGYKAAFVPHLRSAGLLGFFDLQRQCVLTSRHGCPRSGSALRRRPSTSHCLASSPDGADAHAPPLRSADNGSMGRIALNSAQPVSSRGH